MFLAPGYEQEFWNLANFGSEGHPEKKIGYNFEDIYGWYKSILHHLLQLSSDDDIE